MFYLNEHLGILFANLTNLHQNKAELIRAISNASKYASSKNGACDANFEFRTYEVSVRIAIYIHESRSHSTLWGFAMPMPQSSILPQPIRELALLYLF